MSAAKNGNGICDSPTQKETLRLTIICPRHLWLFYTDGVEVNPRRAELISVKKDERIHIWEVKPNETYRLLEIFDYDDGGTEEHYCTLYLTADGQISQASLDILPDHIKQNLKLEPITK